MVKHEIEMIFFLLLGLYLKSTTNRYIVEVIQFMRGVGMANSNNQIITKVSPYDDSLWDHYSMYDNLPYSWDTDLNIERTFVKITGNVIKAYRCKIKDSYETKSK